MAGLPLALLAGAATVAAAKKALVIVDVQDCFLENGSLPVVASQIIPKLNEIRNQKDCLFDVVVKTQDFHPAGHLSFGTTHGMPQDTANAAKSNSWRGAMSMKCIKDAGKAACCPSVYINRTQVSCNPPLEYCPTDEDYYNATTNPTMEANPACATCGQNPELCFDQTMDLWLDHCLQDGDSRFASNLVSKPTDKVVQKGQDRYVEMFSGFFDNTRQYSSSLHQTLQDAGVTEVFAAGIATTHCVRWTVEDAVFLGYKTNVIMDASAGIWGTPTSYANETEAIAGFRSKNITVMNTADVLSMACSPSPSPELSAAAPSVLATSTLTAVLLATARALV
eukprot:TRINITY_DN110750_c0_g1_i1.p1 TRINITY_DN110750_c0_g1~~TRINITY_DN110750_c0_g1_i1.p1  ORF type:complete len:337 (+),score=54.81 TRINITY_DN110750_c0_g1_i1:134-1144(+)